MAVTAILIQAPPAAADGTVSGSLILPPPDQRPQPPQRSHGFLPRANNPRKAVRPYDPLPYMVVVLEGNGAGEGAAHNQRVRYTLIGESFATPLLAVTAGTEIELRNDGSRSPRLYVPGHDDLLPGTPLNPTDSLAMTVSTPNTLITIRDRDTVHLIGRVVAFSHSLFAQPDADGKATIADVPSGNYSVKVWYRDGWLKIQPTTVDVGSGTARFQIQIPTVLETEN